MMEESVVGVVLHVIAGNISHILNILFATILSKLRMRASRKKQQCQL